MWKFRKFSPTAKIFRQIDLQYNSLDSEKVNLTEFLQNIVGEKICKFPHCSFEKANLIFDIVLMHVSIMYYI